MTVDRRHRQDELRGLIEAVLPKIGSFGPPPPYYTRSPDDDHNDFCLACAKKEVARHGVSGLWADDPDEEWFERPYVAGGPGFSETDTSTFCDSCGCLLQYTLTAEGASGEIDYFADSEPPTTPEGWYQLLVAAESYLLGEPDPGDLDRAARVVRAVLAAAKG